MPNYRVNKNTFTNPNGDNEVHVESCQHYNQLNDYEYLGNHTNCEDAVKAAKLKGYRADGCKICIPDCNRG